MPSLAEFQRDFAAALQAPSMPGGASEAPGLRIHRNTAMKGLLDALLANYPTVGVLMGEAWLTEVALEYARRYPPRHAVLAGYGDSFPAFLATLEAHRDWPYLQGVAALDRAWAESLLAPDAPALSAQRLAGVEPQALASLRIQLHPASRTGFHGHSAVTIWEANRPPAVPPAELTVDGRDEAALIVRNESGVQLLRLDGTARAFVESIIAGHSIGAAASIALELMPDGDVAAAWSVLLAHGAFAVIDSQGD